MNNNLSKEENDIIDFSHKLSLNEFNTARLRVDSSQNRIYIDNNEQVLQPKVMQLLLFLCAAEGKTLTKSLLNNLLWPNTQVGPDSLANTMARLRKALNDSSKHPEFIETVQRKGYRWLQPVEQPEIASINRAPKRYIIVSLLFFVVAISYWSVQREVELQAEEFPFTDLTIEKNESGMEIKVGIDAEFSQLNQEKIKQEISRITGKDIEQLEITLDPDCTLEEIENKQTKNCNLGK